MSLITGILVTIFVLYTLVMIPIQYGYLTELKKRQEKLRVSQNQLYERMSFEEEQLHFHHQGSMFNWLPAIIASMIYKRKHRSHRIS